MGNVSPVIEIQSMIEHLISVMLPFMGFVLFIPLTILIIKTLKNIFVGGDSYSYRSYESEEKCISRDVPKISKNSSKVVLRKVDNKITRNDSKSVRVNSERSDGTSDNFNNVVLPVIMSDDYSSSSYDSSSSCGSHSSSYDSGSSYDCGSSYDGGSF